MDPGEVPKDISALTPIELIFIAKAKVFQTVIKLGAVGKNVPSNSRLSALKGNAIHMPLPLEQTIKQLDEDTDFTKIPANYIMTHHIKDDELLLRNLVNLDKVYAALAWLKNKNPFYRDINLPNRPELLFTSVMREKSPVPTHTCELASSSDDDTDLELAASKSGNPSNEETIVKNGKDQNGESTNNENVKPRNSDIDDFNVIDNVEHIPEVSEDDYENNPSKMIQKLSSLQIQSLLEQYSVVDNNLQGKSIMDVENFYKFLD